MSFTKAKIKRFNEQEGCAPPVGIYNPKIHDKTLSPGFTKSERFRTLTGWSTTQLPALNLECGASVKKQLNSLSRIPSTSSLPSEYTKIQECEKEIRRLLKERSELLKQLAVKEGELKKLEGKLHTALRDRGHSQASAVLFEKKSKELGRINEILKMKLTTLEEANKKKNLVLELATVKGTLLTRDHTIDDLKQELYSVKKEHDNCGQALSDKNKEILAVKDEMMSTLLSMETKLAETKEKMLVLEDEKNHLVTDKETLLLDLRSLEDKLLQYESMVASLTNTNDELVGDLKSCQAELETKQQQMDKLSEELLSENLLLRNRIEDQVSELATNKKLLTLELVNAYQKLQSTEDSSQALQHYKDALDQRVITLKDSISEMEDWHLLDIQTIQQLKLELMDVSAQLSAKEQCLLEANACITAMNDQLEELKLTKEQLITVTERCQQLEKEIAGCEYDRQARVDGLEVELLVTKLTCQTIENDLTEMCKSYSELQGELKSKSGEFAKLKQEFEDQQEIAASEVLKLKNDVETFQKDLSLKDEELQKLDDLFQMHTSEMKSLQEKLRNESQEKANILEMVDEKERDIQMLKEKLQQAESEREEMATNLQKSESELVCFKQEMNSTMSNIENELKFVKEDNDLKTQEVNNLVENCNNIKSFLEAEIATLNKSLEELTEDLSRIREEKESLTKLLEEKDKTLKEVQLDLEISDRKLAECRQEKEECRIVKEELMENVKNLQIHLSMLKSESEELKNILINTQTEMKIMSSECEDHKTKVSKILDEKFSLEKQLEGKSRDFEAASDALSSHVAEIEVVNKELKEKSDSLFDVTKALRAAEEQVIQLTQNNEEVTGSKKVLEEQCESLKEQIKARHCELDIIKSNSELEIALLSEKLQQVQKENQDMANQFQEIKNANDVLQGHLNYTLKEIVNLEASLKKNASKIADLECKSSHLTDLVQTKAATVENLQTDLISKTAEIERVTNELQTMHKMVLTSEEEVQSLRESLEKRQEEISELQTIIENNHKVMSENQDNSIIEDLRSTTEELSSLQEICQEQRISITAVEKEKGLLKDYVEQLETKLERHAAQEEWFFNREKDLLREISIVEQQAQQKQQEYVKLIRDAQKQLAALQGESESYKVKKEKEGRQNEEMLQAVTSEYESRMRTVVEKLEDSSREILRWKTMYEDLKAKVAPFQDQLDAFEIERNVLMSQNNETMSDLQKLSQQYASLLGHQNHRQKIHYVYKLKEETLQLKEENVKLRTEVLKLKKAVHQQRDNLGTARKFDPSKAFMHHNKENDASFRDVLSVTNK